MQYIQKNDQAVQQEAARLEKQANEWGVGAPMLYLLSGATQVRILPPHPESGGVFFAQVLKHRIRVANRTEAFVCPSQKGQPCAVCAKCEEFTLSKDDAKMTFAREQLRPRAAYLYNVLAFHGPANKKGEAPKFGTVYVMEAGVTVHRSIISLDQDTIGGWHDVTNPEHGVTLIIKRTGQGLQTEYAVTPSGLGRSNIFADCQARGIDPAGLTLFNLNEVFTVPTPEKIAEVLGQIGNIGGAIQLQPVGGFGNVQPVATSGFLQPVGPFPPAIAPITVGPAYVAPQAGYAAPQAGYVAPSATFVQPQPLAVGPTTEPLRQFPGPQPQQQFVAQPYSPGPHGPVGGAPTPVAPPVAPVAAVPQAQVANATLPQAPPIPPPPGR